MIKPNDQAQAVLSFCLHLNQSLPALVLLGLTLACPWESLLGEACLGLLHPWHVNSQHHVDRIKKKLALTKMTTILILMLNL